ncbi:cyclic pyranopterin monophosphate synthase MoaC [Roseobacter sp.]|uniref:cyclic pyranopterin monophosphate synthase MoaC n=1 Tax=Roseobacter sp. TaxID=1907202 RepID=UPI003296E1BF
MTNTLTHFDGKGDAHMVDVGQKPITDRIAVARCHIQMQPGTFDIIQQGSAKKGDVLGVARIAGIMAAKRTSDLIPLCHPLPITKVTVEFSPRPDLPGYDIEATVKTTGQTGVEMEALTAASVTALTVYDMTKAVDKSMQIGELRVALKDGGKSGRFEAP